MKKSMILLVMCILLAGISVNGQTNKGNIFLAGNSDLGFSFGKEKYKSGDIKENQRSYFDFDIDLYSGYFLINNLTAGLYLDLGYAFSKDLNDDDKWNSLFFAVGPFVRYYFLDLKLKPYGHAQLGIGLNRYKIDYGTFDYKYKESYFTYFLGAGADYFLNDHVALDLLLGFEHDAYKHKIDEGGERNQDFEKFIYNSFVVKLGVVVILGQN